MGSSSLEPFIGGDSLAFLHGWKAISTMVGKPQYCLCWPTSVCFIMTLQKGGLDRPSKLRLCEQKYSLSWGKKGRNYINI